MNGLHDTETWVVDGDDLAGGHAIAAPRKKRGLSCDGPPDAAESGASLCVPTCTGFCAVPSLVPNVNVSWMEPAVGERQRERRHIF